MDQRDFLPLRLLASPAAVDRSWIIIELRLARYTVSICYGSTGVLALAIPRSYTVTLPQDWTIIKLLITQYVSYESSGSLPLCLLVSSFLLSLISFEMDSVSLSVFFFSLL